LVVISLLVDFETSTQERLRRKLLDCEPDGVRRVPEASISNGSTPGFLLATGEQLRRGVIIKFDYGLFDRHLFERDFSVHAFTLLFSFDVMAPLRVLVRLRVLALQDKPRASS
jgi:hypothetical protein